MKQFPSCEGVEGEEVLEKAVAEEEEKSDQKLIGGMTDQEFIQENLLFGCTYKCALYVE